MAHFFNPDLGTKVSSDITDTKTINLRKKRKSNKTSILADAAGLPTVLRSDLTIEIACDSFCRKQKI